MLAEAPDELEKSLWIGKLSRAEFLLEAKDALLVDNEDRPLGAIPLDIVDAVCLAGRPVDVTQKWVRQAELSFSG